MTVGSGASSTSSYSVVVGSGASSSFGGNGDSVIIGTNSASSAQLVTVLGYGATANNSYSIALGNGATTTAANQIVINGVSTGYFGNGVTNAAPGNFTLQGTGSSTAGTAGANFTVQSGAGDTSGTGSNGGNLILEGANAGGTGNNNGGSILLQAGSATGTGSPGTVTIKNAENSTSAFQVQNAGGTTVFGIDTTNDQLLSGIPSGGNAFVLNTTTAYTSGYLLEVMNNGTVEFSVDSAGNVIANSISVKSATVNGYNVCTTADNCPGMPLVTYSITASNNFGVAASTWTVIDTLPSFIVPASGEVRVQVYGGDWQTNGLAPVYSGVMIGGTVQASTVQENGLAGGGASTAYLPAYNLDVILSGLTPGANETLEIGGYVSGTNGNFYTGEGNPGPGILTAVVSAL